MEDYKKRMEPGEPRIHVHVPQFYHIHAPIDKESREEIPIVNNFYYGSVKPSGRKRLEEKIVLPDTDDELPELIPYDERSIG